MAQRPSVTLHQHLTKKQKLVLHDRSDHLLLTGVAGTGKTYTALARGLMRLDRQEVERIVIIRSAVSTRPLGFLPGSDEEKLDPYTAAYEHLAAQISPKMNYAAMVSKGMIEFPSTSFLRGTTFDYSYVLVDEYQNMSAHELHTIATRVGKDTELVICGDSDQSDLLGAEAKEHMSVVSTFERMVDDANNPSFSVYRFGIEDIVRSGFVKHYYEARAT